MAGCGLGPCKDLYILQHGFYLIFLKLASADRTPVHIRGTCHIWCRRSLEAGTLCYRTFGTGALGCSSDIKFR
ncbi:MAG: hypothetical protein H3Z50_02010 [archaeon]|nr:hypothetical protein [archaeon]MCP8306925.1 hypothetical protein [archaeon]